MKKVAILEDNKRFVRLLLQDIKALEERRNTEIHAGVFNTQKAVIESFNPSVHSWDAVLLDYFAPDGTFFVFDFSRAKLDTVIAMSSEPAKNKIALDKGVACAVEKDYRKLGTTSYTIVGKLEEILFG